MFGYQNMLSIHCSMLQLVKGTHVLPHMNQTCILWMSSILLSKLATSCFVFRIAVILIDHVRY